MWENADKEHRPATAWRQPPAAADASAPHVVREAAISSLGLESAASGRTRPQRSAETHSANARQSVRVWDICMVRPSVSFCVLVLFAASVRSAPPASATEP